MHPSHASLQMPAFTAAHAAAAGLPQYALPPLLPAMQHNWLSHGAQQAVQAAAAAAAASASMGATNAAPNTAVAMHMHMRSPSMSLTTPAAPAATSASASGSGSGSGSALSLAPAARPPTSYPPPPSEKTRDALLFDQSMSYPEAFAAWVKDRQRERVFTDEHHAEVIRVLDTRDTSHRRYKGWVRAGYFAVTQPDGTKALYIRCKVEKAAPRGSTAGQAMAAQEAAQATAAANAQAAATAAAAAVGADHAMHGEDGSGTNAASNAVQAVAAAAAAAAASLQAQSPPSKIEVRRVLSASEIPPTIARIHEANHGGTRSLYFQLSAQFHGIPRVACEAFVARCVVCALKQAKRAANHFDFGGAAAIAAAQQHAVAQGYAKMDASVAEMHAATGGALVSASTRSLHLKRPVGALSSPSEVLAAASFANFEGKRARFAASAAAAAAASSNAALIPAVGTGPPLSSAFTSADMAVMSAFWSEQLRALLQRLFFTVHPPPPTAAPGMEVPAALRRQLSITPLALHELSQVLGGLLGHMLCGLEQQILKQLRRVGAESGQHGEAEWGVSDVAATVEGWLMVLSAGLTRGSSLGHRVELAARRAVHARVKEEGDASSTLPPALVRFITERLVRMGLKDICPNVALLFDDADADADANGDGHSGAVDVLISFLSGMLHRWALELLEAGGVVAHSYLASTVQAWHLSDFVASQPELRAQYVEYGLLAFSMLGAADSEQLWPAVDESIEEECVVATQDRVMWWSPGMLTESRKEAALACILAPEQGGFPQSFVRWGIVPLSRHRMPSVEGEGGAAPEAEIRAAAAQPPAHKRAKRGAAAAAPSPADSASASAPDESRKYDAQFAVFAAEYAAGVYTPSHLARARARAPSDGASDSSEGAPSPPRYMAEVDVTDGAGNIIPLHVERTAPVDKDQDEPAPSDREPLPSGRVWHRMTGRVIAEVLEETPDSGACVMLENAAPLSRPFLPLDSHTFVPTASMPSAQEEAQAAQQAQEQGQGGPSSSLECTVRVQSDECDMPMVAPGVADVPPLARVVRQALSLVHDPPTGDAALSYASAQPLPLRVELRTRLLLRHAFVDVRHELSRRPELLQIIAEFDPAYLPHCNLPPILQVQSQQQGGNKGAAAGVKR